MGHVPRTRGNLQVPTAINYGSSNPFFCIFLHFIRFFGEFSILSVQNWYIWVLQCLLGVSKDVVHVRKHLVYAGNDAQSTIFGCFWSVLTIFDVLLYWWSSWGYTWCLPVPVSTGIWPLVDWVKNHTQNTPGLLLAFTNPCSYPSMPHCIYTECWATGFKSGMQE